MPMKSSEGPINIMGAGLSGLSAAIILAKAGREVHVYDIRKDSGSRFDGDFQGLENWTSDTDFFDELRGWGIDPDSFKSTTFHQIDLIHPDNEITNPWSEKVSFRVVERGTDSHAIDQGLKRQAIEAGAQIHYREKIKPEECHIVATGPKGVSAVAYGEIFHTTYPNHVSIQLNDKLAPGAYSYLIIIDGIGLICTCLWRKQKNPDRYLNETIAWYEEHYPELDREPFKRVGGKGDFTINQKYKENGTYYVGEAGGLQDFMWGFGMRYAITSGVLAAHDILGKSDYEKDLRKILLPQIKSSVSNRFLLNRIGDKGFKRICKYWMKDQNKKGDGLLFMKWVYRWDILRKIVYHSFAKFMLKKTITKDGRKVYQMPFRKALKRDVWEQSSTAENIGKQWNEVRRSKKGKVSFSEDSDEVTIPSEEE